ISKKSNTIIFDVSKVEYISSEGLFALVTVHRELRDHGGVLVIFSPKNELTTLFKAIGVYNELVFSNSMEDATSKAESGRSISPAPSPHVSSPQNNREEKITVRNESRVENETVFENPLVIECEECNSFVRVYSSGQFMCPSCRTEFAVNNEGTVVF
ncbi:MAG TPA: STAS domain-containing protein, partial [Spirochaetota bacterium]